MAAVPVPSSKLIEGWQSSLETQVQEGELTDTMRRTYEWGFAQFLDWLTHSRLESVSNMEIQNWVQGLEEQGHNSFSVSFWLSCVKNFFSWAHKNGNLTNDPSVGVRIGGAGMF